MIHPAALNAGSPHTVPACSRLLQLQSFPADMDQQINKKNQNLSYYIPEGAPQAAPYMVSDDVLPFLPR